MATGHLFSLVNQTSIQSGRFSDGKTCRSLMSVCHREEEEEEVEEVKSWHHKA